MSFNGQGGNPSVAFEGATPNVLISLNDDEISPIDVQYVRGDGPSVQEVIVTKSLSDSKCASIGETGNPIDPVYAMYKGELWIHDPRFVSYAFCQFRRSCLPLLTCGPINAGTY